MFRVVEDETDRLAEARKFPGQLGQHGQTAGNGPKRRQKNQGAAHAFPSRFQAALIPRRQRATTKRIVAVRQP
jgi:hypothetical protein